LPVKLPLGNSVFFAEIFFCVHFTVGCLLI
jgi:hypothetical protein